MAYTESWLELEKSMGTRLVLKGTPEEIRAQYDGLTEMLLPQLPKANNAVTSTDGIVDGIKYRLYTPKDAASKGRLPIAIWTHGGGYMIGDLHSDDLLIRIIAEHTSSIVLEDALTVYKWARQNAASFGGDPSKFYTIGGSAGGSLALQVVNRLAKDASSRNDIRGVAAIVPAVLHYENVPEEYKSMYTAYKENAVDVPVIDMESMAIFYRHVGAKADDPELFVALDTENHKNFPPVYFVSCAKDPLRDDAYVMEAALKKAGVSTKHDHYKGLPHYFWIFPSVPEGQQFVGNLIGGITWLLSQM